MEMNYVCPKPIVMVTRIAKSHYRYPYTYSKTVTNEYSQEHKAGSRFSMFACKFTTNTYLMVILPPGEARFNSAKLNCQIARESFKFLDGPVTVSGPGQNFNS